MRYIDTFYFRAFLTVVWDFLSELRPIKKPRTISPDVVSAVMEYLDFRDVMTVNLVSKSFQIDFRMVDMSILRRMVKAYQHNKSYVQQRVSREHLDNMMDAYVGKPVFQGLMFDGKPLSARSMVNHFTSYMVMSLVEKNDHFEKLKSEISKYDFFQMMAMLLMGNHFGECLSLAKYCEWSWLANFETVVGNIITCVQSNGVHLNYILDKIVRYSIATLDIGVLVELDMELGMMSTNEYQINPDLLDIVQHNRHNGNCVSVSLMEHLIPLIGPEQIVPPECPDCLIAWIFIIHGRVILD